MLLSVFSPLAVEARANDAEEAVAACRIHENDGRFAIAQLIAHLGEELPRLEKLFAVHGLACGELSRKPSLQPITRKEGILWTVQPASAREAKAGCGVGAVVQARKSFEARV